MDIKKIKEKENILTLEVSGINETEANTLRRLMIVETPVMAIEEVEIMKNDSALYDEMLTHRLGLIPLKTETSYKLKNRVAEKEKNTSKCEVKLTLETKGPKTVYAKDLESSDPKIKPVYEDMPIVILTENQEIKLIATAELGKGKNHMKFSPGIVMYKHKPILKLATDLKIIQKYKDSLPKNTMKDNKLDEETIVEKDLYEVLQNISQDLVKVDYEKNKFIFTIESFGQLSSTEIFANAIQEFEYKLDEFSKKLGSSKNLIKILKK